jgi:hypothetical protein
MPITYSIDRDANLITTIGSGNVTLDEVREHFDELVLVLPHAQRLDVLLDLTRCTSLPGLYELRAVVQHMDSFGERLRFGRCAIVATRELLYGLLRVFEIYAGSKFEHIRVFRSEMDAKEWLFVHSFG